jgi:hypothetical protein
MAWADLCGGGVVDGKAIDLKTLIGPNVDHDKRGKSGLPDASVLANMVTKAGGLKLKDGNGKGIAFTICEATVNNDNTVNAAQKYKDFVKQKGGAGVCYEDTILPLVVVANRHVIVHQSVAPCKRCRAGYKAWAVQLGSTIVVSADDGYDGAPKDSTFIFCPTGLVFYG